MKKYFSVAIILLLVVIAGCKKDKEEEIPNTNKIKSILANGWQRDYFYKNGILDYEKALLLNSGNHPQIKEYQYSTGMVAAASYTGASGDFLFGRDTLFLNADGLKTTASYWFMNGPGFTEQVWYDANKFPIKYFNSLDGSVTKEYVWANGNKISTMEYDSARQLQKRYYYDYYTDKTNNITSENFGKAYEGKTNANPVKTITVITAAGDTSKTLYNYIFDSQSRIATSVGRDINGALLDSAAYSYY